MSILNPTDYPEYRTEMVAEEIRNERETQRRKWGNDHDDAEGYRHLVGHARERTFAASQTACPEGAARILLVEAAAMLVAAVEAIDRRTCPNPAPTTGSPA